MAMLQRFIRHAGASTAAEFALVLPTALLLLFGIIDVGRYAWQLNEYEKATQMATRMAVVTDIASTGLASSTLTYVGNTSCGAALVAGQRICSEALGTITCTSTACSCTGNCPTSFSTQVVTAAMQRIVGRVQQFQPRVAANQVTVEYRGSGIGYAGDPKKPEISPIVTVRVSNARYEAITLSPVGGTVALPDFSYSLTLEDGLGAASG
ncbi:MAG: TadE/TadG family type IV pilus assembly protein [Pseudomonadota bacterium]